MSSPISNAIASPQNIGILVIVLLLATPGLGARVLLIGMALTLLGSLWYLVPRWRDMRRVRELLAQI